MTWQVQTSNMMRTHLQGLLYCSLNATMIETDTPNDWLRNTDSVIDGLCHEIRDWLTEYLHRPKMLVTFTLALGGSEEPPSTDTPFEHFRSLSKSPHERSS